MRTERRRAVSNPFLKKNPWLSMWLSGANTLLSAGRAQWEAAARQQQAAMMREASRATTEFWTEALKPAELRREPPARRRKKAKR
jgi:hypothetical protein